MDKPLVGIMQGRLVPPETEAVQTFPHLRWKDEFALAAQVGFDCIEWIYDATKNPVSSDAGINEIKELADHSGVRVMSICADYFMKYPLLNGTSHENEERLNHLIWLLGRAEILDVKYVLLPFVDSSRLRDMNDIRKIAEILNSVLNVTSDHNVEIHLETSLPPKEFAFLLSLLPSPRIKANYDSGNSASLGYQITEEFAAYGKRIGSVHVKDRILNGGTVPLGEGNAQLPSLFHELKHHDYQGNVILQIARDQSGEEVSWARHNREYVMSLIDEYFGV